MMILRTYCEELKMKYNEKYLIEFILNEHEIEKLKSYEEFLKECSFKNYLEIDTQVHHILPKFMGGTNNPRNLIKLSTIDHRDAHIILADCFDKKTREYIGNIKAAQYCQKWIDGSHEILKRRLSECMKNRYVSEETKQRISESKKKYYMNLTASGLKPPRTGLKHSEETLQIIAEKAIGNQNMKGKRHSEETIKLIKEKRFQQIITPESRIKCIETRKKNGRPWHTDDGRLRISKSKKENPQPNNKKPIIHKFTGLVFATKKMACDFFDISNYLLGKKIAENEFELLNVHN